MSIRNLFLAILFFFSSLIHCDVVHSQNKCDIEDFAVVDIKAQAVTDACSLNLPNLRDLAMKFNGEHGHRCDPFIHMIHDWKNCLQTNNNSSMAADHSQPIKWIVHTGQWGMGSSIPVIVSARIEKNHVTNKRKNFRANVNPQMKKMQAILPSNSNCIRKSLYNCDEKGHIVANAVSGSVEWWNLAPQSTALNRNVHNNTDWIVLENAVRHHANYSGSVDWVVIVNYSSNDRPNRPSEFAVCTQFYDKQNKTHGDATVHVFDNTPILPN